MDEFNEEVFNRRLEGSLKVVRTVLDSARNPRYPLDVPHVYQDKYLLAEVLTQVALAAQITALNALGLSAEMLSELVEAAATRTVTLRFAAEQKCSFEREVKRDVDSASKSVTEIGSMKIVSKSVTTISEYFWKFEQRFQLFAFVGSSPDDKKLLITRDAKCEVKTGSKASPRPEMAVKPNIDVDITWLLKQLDPETLVCRFKIDRTDKNCHTPRRNGDIEGALSFWRSLYLWSSSVGNFFTGDSFPMQNQALDMTSLNDNEFFVPIIALFEGRANEEQKDAIQVGLIALEPWKSSLSNVVLSLGDVTEFLIEHKRSLIAKFETLGKVFPSDQGLITPIEASLVVIARHLITLAQAYSDGVNYTEFMLRKQLISAIGKEISSSDFGKYMVYHNRQIFRPEYEPRPFCYAVRRPLHYPEGVVSFESHITSDGSPEPAMTNVKWISSGKIPMKFPLNAASKVSFFGDRFLHAYVTHEFSGQSEASLSLNARARQFSSFILLVGRIASASFFIPKHAIIIQNKDELKIPLLLEQIPSAKEFQNAIESLSPEQQRFTKAYRGMQLESTLFGVAIIQIKPQLEKLLNLPADTLTKEIRLTQDLMELFTKYQIPSDLLSYGGDVGLSNELKISKVKQYVQEMFEMINDSKQKQIAERKEEAQFTVYNSIAATAGDTKVVLKKKKKISKDKEKDVAREDRSKPRPKFEALQLQTKRSIASVSLSLKQSTPPMQAVEIEPPIAQSPEPPHDSQSSELKLQNDSKEIVDLESSRNSEADDLTEIPSKIDTKLLEVDADGAVRPSIIHVGPLWTRKVRKSLLSSEETESLGSDLQDKEKDRAFDLLDALSKSGTLPFEDSSLHVVVAATHNFDKTLMDCVIQDNFNPIEKVERSILALAETVQDKSIEEMLKPSQLDRVKTYSPILFSTTSSSKLLN